jgi:hypothetical protein
MITSGGQVYAANLRIRPSRRWYWVGGGVLAGALVCIVLGVAGFFSVNRQINDFQRVRVPGQARVTFTQPGGYVLYVEGPGHCCSFAAGSGGSAPFPSWSMNVALLPLAGGPPVPLHVWRGVTESYTVTGHQGQTAMYVTIGHPGRYVLGARHVVPPSVTDIAVGRGIGHGALTSLLLILFAVFVLLPAGLLVGGITAFRRRRARSSPAPGATPQDPMWQGPMPQDPMPPESS